MSDALRKRMKPLLKLVVFNKQCTTVGVLCLLQYPRVGSVVTTRSKNICLQELKRAKCEAEKDKLKKKVWLTSLISFFPLVPRSPISHPRHATFASSSRPTFFPDLLTFDLSYPALSHLIFWTNYLNIETIFKYCLISKQWNHNK